MLSVTKHSSITITPRYCKNGSTNPVDSNSHFPYSLAVKIPIRWKGFAQFQPQSWSPSEQVVVASQFLVRGNATCPLLRKLPSSSEGDTPTTQLRLKRTRSTIIIIVPTTAWVFLTASSEQSKTRDATHHRPRLARRWWENHKKLEEIPLYWILTPTCPDLEKKVTVNEKATPT